MLPEVLCWLVIKRSGLLPPRALLHLPGMSVYILHSARKGKDTEKTNVCHMEGQMATRKAHSSLVTAPPVTEGGVSKR